MNDNGYLSPPGPNHDPCQVRLLRSSACDSTGVSAFSFSVCWYTGLDILYTEKEEADIPCPFYVLYHCSSSTGKHLVLRDVEREQLPPGVGEAKQLNQGQHHHMTQCSASPLAVENVVQRQMFPSFILSNPLFSFDLPPGMIMSISISISFPFCE